MKILLVHNNYGKYSGEESVVDKMANMLTAHGYDVASYRRTTEGMRESIAGKVEGFLSGIYSPSGVRGMREALRRERPDVVNVHNLYPFISPAALFECKKAGVPVIMTVHNFRLICPTGLFMRDGMPCETCLERGNEWSCVRYNCEHSRLKSLGYTLRNVYARWTGAYRKNVDAFACITDFQRQKLIAAGYDAQKMQVIPNSVEVPDSYLPIEGSYVAYIGRLSYEKGYDLLVEVARRNPSIQLRFAGAKREMPSRCYEGFPVAILEAACYGKPTIGPAHGGFTEIIGAGESAIGRLFIPNNIDDLERQVVSLWHAPDKIARLGHMAFDKLQREYSSEVVYKKWNSLFQELVYGRNQSETKR